MNDKMRVNLAELLPIIEEQLAQGKEVCFSPNGISMLPMLVPERDSVVLKAAPSVLKKYDLPLYRRENGQFVLHRVVRVLKNNTYVMCGDNQFSRERGIKNSQIIGVVTRFVRDGQEISCKNIRYRIYCILRVKSRFVLGFFLRAKRKILKKLSYTDKKGNDS